MRIIEIAINSNILTLNHEVVLADFNSIRAEVFKQKETQGKQSENHLWEEIAGILGTKSVSLSFSLVDMIGNHVKPFYGSLTGKVDVILWVL